MNKTELIDAIHDHLGTPKSIIGAVLEAQATVITEHLASPNNTTAEEAVLPGLGKLKTSLKAARTGRNPKTGEAVVIPERLAVKFAPAKALKDALNT